MAFATRIYGRDDGLEYSGDVYSTLAKARKGIKETVKEMRKYNGQSIDWHIYKWSDSGYGEMVDGSDI